VRKGLTESERWLTLKDNADRLAYVWLLLHVDDYANYSAERYRLMRAWRDFGITTIELVAKTLTELQDHDMIGLYDVDGRPFLHLMRFYNTKQWWTRSYPQSPFADDKNNPQKQRDTELGINHDLSHHKPGVRGLGLGVESVGIVSIKTKSKPKAVAQAPFVPPDWIPAMQWDAWIDMRTKARKKPTTLALKIAVSKLDELRAAGHHPAAVLAQSVFNGWAGLFPLKKETT
jgi:hypothetical protein